MRFGSTLSRHESVNSFVVALAGTAAAGRRPLLATGPTPGEVLTEIGLLLAIHLALAFAVAVTLRLFGIA